MPLILSAFAAAAIGTAALLAALCRLFPADFLSATKNREGSKPFAKSQIGGLAIMPAILAVLLCASVVDPQRMALYLSLAAASAMLSVIGYLDDRYDLPIAPRLAIQLIAAALALWALWPSLTSLDGTAPNWIRFALLLLALVWFINLTNFMDGMDLALVSGLGLPFAFVALVGASGLVDPSLAVVAAAAAGGLLAFAPRNWPPAPVILGDSGSLPLGLFAGVVVVSLAQRTESFAAVLPFAYLAGDATSTIVLRLYQGKSPLQGHAEHAYQLAIRAGRPALAIVGRIASAVLVVCLVSLTALADPGSVTNGAAAFGTAAITAGVILVLRRRGKTR